MQSDLTRGGTVCIIMAGLLTYSLFSRATLLPGYPVDLRRRLADYSCGAAAEFHGIPVFIPQSGNHDAMSKNDP